MGPTLTVIPSFKIPLTIYKNLTSSYLEQSPFFFLLPAMLLCKDGWNSPLAIGGHQSCSLDNDRTEHMLFKARAPC